MWKIKKRRKMNDKEGKKHDTVNVTYPSIHQELGFHQF